MVKSTRQFTATAATMILCFWCLLVVTSGSGFVPSRQQDFSAPRAVAANPAEADRMEHAISLLTMRGMATPSETPKFPQAQEQLLPRVQSSFRTQADIEHDVSLLATQRMVSTASVAAKTAAQRAGRMQTSRERQVMADFGRLEDRYEEAERMISKLEAQINKQAATDMSIHSYEVRAAHEELVAVTLWWRCRLLVLAVAIFVCATAMNSVSCRPAKKRSVQKQPAKPNRGVALEREGYGSCLASEEESDVESW